MLFRSGWDKIGAYLLFTTSADGSFASEARETAIRVVCNNTISMAVAQIPGKHYVKINHRQAFDAKAVKSQLELGAEHFQAFKELATLMTKAKVSEMAAEQFVTELLRPVAADADETEQQEASRRPRGPRQDHGPVRRSGPGRHAEGLRRHGLGPRQRLHGILRPPRHGQDRQPPTRKCLVRQRLHLQSGSVQ